MSKTKLEKTFDKCEISSKNAPLNSYKSVQDTLYNQSKKPFFTSFETFQNYVKGLAYNSDHYTKVWNSLGFEPNQTKKTYHNAPNHNNKKKKAFCIYKSGSYKDFYNDTKGTIFDFLQTERNLSIERAFEYVASQYNFTDYKIGFDRTEKRKINRSNPQNSQTKPNTNQDKGRATEPIKTDLEKETLAYYKTRISEIGLSEQKAKNYFFPSLNRPYGIGIKYIDLDKNTLTFGSDNKTFERVRLTRPYTDKKGKTAKYLSPKDSGTFPYITALSHANKDVTTGKTLYITEGEIKALFSVNTLKLPFVGIGGISQTAQTEKDIFGYPIYKTAHFDRLTKEVILRFEYENIHLVFDSDSFQNKGKDDRYKQFFAAVKKAFIAAQKLEIKKFTFSVINPNNSHKAKGIDDFNNVCDAMEIRTKLTQKNIHNDLFWHFRLDTKQKPQKALKSLEDAFKASFQIKPQPTTITIKDFLGGKLLENKEFVNSILTEQYTYLNAPTGLGKSYFVQHYLTPFLNKKGYVVLFAAPRNAIAKQQAAGEKEKGKIVFTADTVSQAIERLKNEDKDIVYTNFDKLREAYEVLTELHGLKVFVVIDEAHLITFDSSYRASVIGSVMDTLKKNPTNLLMTATPTELSFDTNNFEVISTNKKAYNRPNLVFCSDNKMTTYALEKALQVIDKGNRVVIHLNDKDEARTLKNTFESRKVKVHYFASDGLNPEEKENFEKMQKKSTFLWNDDKNVIITTSVLEAGINIKTDRAVTNIYLNKTPFGFNNTSYRQFIARIRNYDVFEVDNIIVTKNYKHFLPWENLVVRYDYQTELELAFENALHHSNQMEKLIKKGIYEKDRFSSSLSKNVYLNEKKEYFEINYQNIFTSYTEHIQQKGSPYFENPTKTFFYENEIDKGIESNTEVLEKEKEKAENEVVEMLHNDFDCLLKSVNKETKDVTLETQTDIKNDSIEAIQLTPIQLQIAEKILIEYFQLLKTSPYKIKDVPKLKHILTCKKSFTVRQTQDLGKRKRNYISYWLLDRKEKGEKTGTEEFFRIEEYHRIISILKQTKGKELTAQQLTDRINKGKHEKNRYTKKTALSVCQMLCNISESKIRNENKEQIKLHKFESVRIWEKELDKLTE